MSLPDIGAIVAALVLESGAMRPELNTGGGGVADGITGGVAGGMVRSTRWRGLGPQALQRFRSELSAL